MEVCGILPIRHANTMLYLVALWSVSATNRWQRCRQFHTNACVEACSMCSCMYSCTNFMIQLTADVVEPMAYISHARLEPHQQHSARMTMTQATLSVQVL